MKKYLLLLLIPTLALAAGRLQNSDFMTEGELTGAGGTAAQLLNDSKVYVTGNGLNKTLDDAIADGDIGTPLSAKGNLVGFGTATEECVLDKTDGKLLTVDSTATCGFDFKDAPIALPDQSGKAGNFLRTNGSTASWQEINEYLNISRDNLLECPNFKCTPDGVITSGAGFDFSGITSRSTEIPAYNGNVLALAQSSAGILDYTVTKSQNFDGQQMMAYCEVKTGNTGVTFNSMANGVVQSTMSVTGDNKWRYYRIPFVGGDTSQGFKVDHTNAGEVPNIEVANCFLGKDANLTQELGQAHFVGKVVIPNSGNSGWKWFDGVTAGYQLPQSDSDCGDAANGEISGNITMADTKVPRFKLTNIIAGATYEVSVTNLIYKATGTDNVSCSLGYSVDGGTTVANVRNFFKGANHLFFTNSLETASFTVKAESSDDIDLDFYIAESTTNKCQIDTRLQPFRVEVVAYPDANSTVVTQDTELTAKTANEFSAIVSGAGVITSTDYDWLSSCTQPSTGNVSCTFNSGVFNTATPSCRVTNTSGVDGTTVINSLTTTSVGFRTFVSGGLSSQKVSFQCSKQGADVNKSQTIVGKFEQVESVMADLTAETANELTMGMSSSSTIDHVNYDWIDSCFSSANGRNGCTFKSGIFTTPPSCVATVRTTSQGTNVSIDSITTTTISVEITNSSNTLVDAPIKIHCSKQGADVNKNISGAIINASKMQQEIADIVLENTASDGLESMEYFGNSGEVIDTSTNIPFETKVRDAKSQWDGDEFTLTHDSCYEADLGFRTTANNQSAVRVYINNIATDVLKIANSAYTIQSHQFGLICASAGDKISFRITSGSLTLTNSGYHRLIITEKPDTASIIKSLNDNNTTKCQTKYLSGDASPPDSILADLTFNNLNIGKRYSMKVRAMYVATSNDTLALRSTVSGTKVCDTYVTSGDGIAETNEIICKFVANGTTLETASVSMAAGSSIRGSGDGDETNIELCELPDSVVETTQF